MRGFRGSRSAQNAISARFGRDHSHLRNSDVHDSTSQDAQVKRPALPDWLKTAETKKAEIQGPVSPSAKLVSVPPVETAPAKVQEKVQKKTRVAVPRKSAAKAKPARKTVAKATTKRKAA